MGLKSGKYGAKAQLLARFPQAFKSFESLVEARDASNATRGETFGCIDGNVCMQSVPQAVTTLEGYVAVLTAILKRAIATCYVTIVVFDEPACMTEAKKQEQMKRDASRASTAVVCSADITSQLPTDDNYSLQYIKQTDNVRPLVDNRATRHRFFDEVAKLVLENLGSQIERWNNSGHDGGHIIFDGVDKRGADRPAGEVRRAEMAGSCSRLISLFAREQPIGEGDLKLAELGRRARWLCETNERGFCNTKLSLAVTIDTDSFAIELIEEAKRDRSGKRPFNTVLCMRERARKRGADDDKEAVYLCCDISMLHALLQRHIWGPDRSPMQSDRQAAMTLLAAGWALAGCDFVSLKGMRSDYVFDAMPIVAKTIPSAIEAAKLAWTGVREDVFTLEMPIRALAMTCASKLAERARKKDVLPSVRDPDQNILLRTAWLMSYWCGSEFKGDMHEFGFVMPFSSD